MILSVYKLESEMMVPKNSYRALILYGFTEVGAQVKSESSNNILWPDLLTFLKTTECIE